jgi:biopolymer transport protein ExbD
MAPMVDIVFLLLIFFIAAAVYSQWESKLEIKVPTSVTAMERPRFPGEAIINIDKHGTFFLNSIELSPERLKSLLGQLSKTYPDQPVVIRADKKTDCKYLIQVIDICAQTDIANISFATTTAETENKK